ncbi:MAG: peptidylprolyl isomerase [Planctomicrobium sp.]|jgi:peptidyl-prolyl cis-trans isomerase A (cyclophilin A)|nr:peptidylprolyl isomerase [Planctomicrobium sp.]
MLQQTNLSLISVCCLLFLTSCVAEKDFEKSSFKAVEPKASEETEVVEDDVEVGEAYSAKFETTKGDFVIEVHPEWAPRGAAQFKEAIEDGVYNEARFFRVLDGFMAQFGIAGDPAKSTKWREKMIADDPVKESNTRGMVTYAMAGPNTRTTQIFINFADNSGSLDSKGFAPFGKVTEGMDVVDSLYSEYGEGAPQGRGPDQGRTQSEGNAYLAKEFPKLDFIKSVSIIEASKEEQLEKTE